MKSKIEQKPVEVIRPKQRKFDVFTMLLQLVFHFFFRRMFLNIESFFIAIDVLHQSWTPELNYSARV